MRVTFNGVDLGATEGGVQVELKTQMADITLDQWGKTPADKRVSGYAFSVKFTLSELKNIDNWKVVFPSAEEIVNGGTKSVLTSMNIGDSLLAHAQQLVLHPLENANSDLSGDYLFYKAASTQVSGVKYGPDKQSGLQVEMTVFPDTTVSPPRFWVYGDPSNGATAASAGAPTAGSNTGNGTITSVAVFSGVTVTETITIQCIGTGSASANVFEVSGSVSGVIGVFTLAHASSSTTNFTSSKISFTATQGATAFVLNDSFTIATTAANFT